MSALPESLVRFGGELEDAIRRDLEAQAAARPMRFGGRPLRAIRKRRGRMIVAFVAVAGVACAALFVSTPWRGSHGFLDRAQAALTPPAGTVLHMKWEMASRACTGTTTYEVWIDRAPPHRYRAFVPKLAAPGPGEPCTTGASIEIGGSDTEKALTPAPPNRLVPTQTFFFGADPDPWAAARKDISEGRAHPEGRTQWRGRTVERIRFDCDRCPTNYGYFDPESLDLVAWDFGNGDVWHYVTWEYLPRTDDNLALTDIRAQHPGATGP